VNEIEAAAVTFEEYACCGIDDNPAPPPPEFRCDRRPFLFAIRDKPSGMVVLLGRLVDPPDIVSVDSDSDDLILGGDNVEEDDDRENNELVDMVAATKQQRNRIT
jgi:hypothetical protein